MITFNDLSHLGMLTVEYVLTVALNDFKKLKLITTEFEKVLNLIDVILSDKKRNLN